MITMGRKPLSSRSADRIRRYQHSDRRRAYGACRFDPTCSQYALDAFESRSYPVAMAMTASRLLRCNPLVRRFTRDPLERPRRGLRPGTARSWSVVMVLVGIGLLFAVSGTASADPPTGGCTGSANGRPAAEITRDNPLKVKSHDTISAKGTTPSGKSGPNLTHVEIFLIDPLGGITTKDKAGNGDTWSSSSVQVDDYLKYGAGTYKVEVTNTGAGWECTFVGYVELDGNPLTKPVGIAAVGITALGAVGGLLAPRKAPTPSWGDGQVQAAYAKRSPMDSILTEGDKVLAAADADKAAQKPKPPGYHDPTDCDICRSGPFCMGCVISAFMMPLHAMPVVGAGGGSLRIVSAPQRPVLWRERVWRRGRPILGFFSGLFFGLGATVLLWQYNVWLLTTVTAIVLPVVLGILFGIYAWIGRPFYVVAYRPDTPPPAAADEPAADAPAAAAPAAAAPAAAAAEPYAAEPEVAPVSDDEPPPPPPPADAPAADAPAEETGPAAEETAPAAEAADAPEDDDAPPPPPPAT
jgi:putative component of membrane protein insertase Oxa1/YidC/SpoIIIJ protein YidD